MPDTATPSKAAAKAKPVAKPKPEPAPRITPGGGHAVQNRNAFYQNGFQLLYRVAIAQGIAIAVLALVLFFRTGSEVEVRTIGLTPDMRVVEIPALTEPFVDTTRVRTWVTDAIAEAYDWDYRNFRLRFSRMESNFTDAGFNSWLATMQESGRVDFVRNNSLLMSYTPRDAIVVGHGPHRGTYRWRIEMQGRLVYSATGRADRVDDVRLVVDVERVDIRQNGVGLAIAQILERRARD